MFIDLSQLPNHQSIIIKSKLQKKLFDEALNKFDSYSKISKLTGIDRHTIFRYHKLKCRKLRFGIIKKICKLLKIRVEELNRNILGFGGVINPKLPFDLNKPEIGTIVGAFLSDGHIEKKLKSARYCAMERELHESLISECEKIFGKINVKIKKGHNVLETRFPPLIAWVMAIIGIPIGCKQNVNCGTPKIIVDGSFGIHKNYLQRVFDDEGDVCFDNYGKRAVRLTRSVEVPIDKNIILPNGRWVKRDMGQKLKHNLLHDELKLLKKFGIRTKIYQGGIRQNKNNVTGKWRLQIADRKSLEIFSEKIGFSLNRKQKKLKKMIDSYIIYQFPNNEIQKICLNLIRDIVKNKKNKMFRYGTILKAVNKKTNKYSGGLGKILIKLETDGNIKKIKRGIYLYNGKKLC